jgi:hypothetical protein
LYGRKTGRNTALSLLHRRILDHLLAAAAVAVLGMLQ